MSGFHPHTGITKAVKNGDNGVIVFPNVAVQDNVPGVNGFSQTKEQDFAVKVTVPKILNCTGCMSFPSPLSPFPHLPPYLSYPYALCLSLTFTRLPRTQANRTRTSGVLIALVSNVCTVRCRNNALAGPFEDLFPRAARRHPTRVEHAC
jgi:hypothetical protein